MTMTLVDVPSLTFEYKNLAKLSKTEVFQLLSHLTEKMNRSYIMLGGLLMTIRKSKWYEPNHTNFQSFCDSLDSIDYRKSLYLISIYESLVENHVPFEEALKVGYTKLVILAPHFTPENYANVIKWALDLSTSKIEEKLAAMAQEAKEFFDKCADIEVLPQDCKTADKVKTNNSVSELKTIILTTPLESIVDALNLLYPTRNYVLVNTPLYA